MIPHCVKLSLAMLTELQERIFPKRNLYLINKIFPKLRYPEIQKRIFAHIKSWIPENSGDFHLCNIGRFSTQRKLSISHFDILSKPQAVDLHSTETFHFTINTILWWNLESIFNLMHKSVTNKNIFWESHQIKSLGKFNNYAYPIMVKCSDYNMGVRLFHLKSKKLISQNWLHRIHFDYLTGMLFQTIPLQVNTFNIKLLSEQVNSSFNVSKFQ